MEANWASGYWTCGSTTRSDFKPELDGTGRTLSLCISPVNHPAGARLLDFYCVQEWQHWPEPLPYPAREDFGRRIVQALDIVKVVMVEMLRDDRIKCCSHISEVDDHARVGVRVAVDVDAHAV
jgi:hypothetical protein